MPLRILIVDDSPVICSLLADAFSKLGHLVVAQVGSVPEAIQTYRYHQPDLVVLDISLIDGNGLAVLKEIRSTNDKTKVIIITSNGQQRIQEEVMAAGDCTFLFKPFGFDQISSALKSLSVT